MSRTAFFVSRSAFVNAQELSRVEDAALRILDEVGVAVLDEDLLAKLRARGFRVSGNRAMIEKRVVREFIDTERDRNGNCFQDGPPAPDGKRAEIELEVSQYPQYVHDLATDRVVPYTTERLVEATKLVDVLHERGVTLGPPGCPSDVPAPLQAVAQYWVAATYSRLGRVPIDAKALVSMPYAMEMAEILGDPIRSLPVYVFSPLTLGGESLRCVWEFKDRLSSLHVTSMPGEGSTAPVHAGDGYALSAAENIGSAMLLQELVELPVTWHIQLYAVDFVSAAMAFGSPQAALLYLMNCDVNAYFHGTRPRPASGTLGTMAKLPGAQSCAEKASAMTLNALLGQRRFSLAGTLSVDEVFSAEQLLYDLEIKDHVEELVRGPYGGCDPDRCLGAVVEGLEQGSFMALHATAEASRQFWRPMLFERGFLGGWLAGGAETTRARTHERIRQLVSAHDYRLEADLQQALDGVLARAKRDLS
ncbi:MAG: trimethylamine methyltransferase family protein [Planctomycetota bacterium]|jgi:trimethylamine--corrinoid protein Co-methyltransferase